MGLISLIIPIIGVIIVAIALFVFYSNMKSKNINSVLNVSIKNIDKITIANGTTGNSYDITGTNNVKEFMDLFRNAKLRKSLNQQKNSGFIFSAILFHLNQAVSRFTFGYDQITVWSNEEPIKYKSSIDINSAQIKQISQKYNL